jgi:hypothetical protein
VKRVVYALSFKESYPETKFFIYNYFFVEPPSGGFLMRHNNDHLENEILQKTNRMRFNILQKVTGSGSAPARNRFAYIAWLNDIVKFPEADYRGVLLLGDIEMKENTGMMQIYLTSSTQEYTYETVGDADSKIFKIKFTGTHPGTEQEALEFVKNFHEEPFIILIPSCDSGVKVLGSPDAPMMFTSSHKSEKASDKFIFNFEQEIGSENVYQLYNGIITLNNNIDVDMGDFLEQLKNYLKLDGTNLSDTQKQNLKTILGIDNKNIANTDLSLSENRSLNLGSYFLNFFSNIGFAKIGINKNVPEESLDVNGKIKSDGLILNENEDDVQGLITRKGNNFYIGTATGKKKIIVEGDYIMQNNGIITPSTPVPTGGWAKGYYTPKDYSPDPGTIYPNAGNLHAIEGFDVDFYFNGTTWESVARKMTVPVGNVSLGETKAVNGDKVYKAVQPINDTFFDVIGVPASPNLVNPANILTGRLVSNGTNTGIIGSSNTAGYNMFVFDIDQIEPFAVSGLFTQANGIAFFSGARPSSIPLTYNTNLISSGTIANVTGSSVVNGSFGFIPPAGSKWGAINIANNTESDNVFATLQIEKGVQTPYQPFNPVDTSYKVLKADFRPKGKIKEIKKAGNLVYIRTDLNATYDLVRTINLYGSSNGGSLLTSSVLVGKSEIITASGTVFHLINDSIPPFQINTKESGYSNLGGNHGTPVLEPTAPAHGKTAADLGSKWTDGNGWNWFLVGIVNSDKLRFVFEPKSVNGFDIIRLGAASPLMHLSGASNTANIIFTIGANDIYEFKPCINNVVVKLYIDGKEITADGTYVGDLVKIVDTHNVVDPTQPNLTAPYSLQYNGTLVNNNIEYTFYPNHVITVDNPADWRKNTSVRNQGIIQPQCLTKGSYSTLMAYVMNLNAVSGNDFKNGFDLTSMAANALPTTADFTEPSKAIQQMSQILFSGSNPVIGGGFGYNPLVGLGKQSELLQNSSLFELRADTKKYYPRGYTRASGTNILRGIGYFAYWDATVNPKLSADYYVPFGKSDLYFLNVRIAMIKEKVKLAKELQLREFSIVNSSAGITIHTLDSSTSEGLIISGSVGDWAVLKFD